MDGNRQFSDPAVRAAYKADVMQRYELYHPQFMNLGIEINSLTDRLDVDALVSLIHETYDDLKKLDLTKIEGQGAELLREAVEHITSLESERDTAKTENKGVHKLFAGIAGLD